MRRVILTMQGVWFAVEKRAGDLLSQLLDVNEKAKKTEALLDELEKERSVFFHFVFIKCVCSGSPVCCLRVAIVKHLRHMLRRSARKVFIVTIRFIFNLLYRCVCVCVCMRVWVCE